MIGADAGPTRSSDANGARARSPRDEAVKRSDEHPPVPPSSAPEAAVASTVPWREQAVARSLDGARARAEQRVQRYLDAATELIIEKGGLDFTVQEVVERSGQSLRSFYQSFDGKQHLLLAVYEEAMHATAAGMRDTVGNDGEVLGRLRRFVVTLYEWSVREPVETPPAPGLTIRAMADFVFGQMSTDPGRVAAASMPLFVPLVELVAEAQEAGALRAGNANHLAATVMQSTMFCAFATPPRGADDREGRAEEMWEFCLRGFGA